MMNFNKTKYYAIITKDKTKESLGYLSCCDDKYDITMNDNEIVFSNSYEEILKAIYYLFQYKKKTYSFEIFEIRHVSIECGNRVALDDNGKPFCYKLEVENHE